MIAFLIEAASTATVIRAATPAACTGHALGQCGLDGCRRFLEYSLLLGGELILLARFLKLTTIGEKVKGPSNLEMDAAPRKVIGGIAQVSVSVEGLLYT